MASIATRIISGMTKRERREFMTIDIFHAHGQEIGNDYQGAIRGEFMRTLVAINAG
ncbi:hypothetical protein [Skermanella stibiiresistens]|uniref:hypothetical protein n=1 Tax=Skermanella stibiiresistens TaxID=913326 RepID=UPI0012F7C6C5|nr:hypothetical protein [Skermanella stibiiresistens]